MPAKPGYQDVLTSHRRKLSQLAESHGTKRLRTLYDRAHDELESKLRKIPGRKDTFTAHQHRMAIAQVRQGQAQISARMAGEVGELSREAQVDSLRGLTHHIKKLSTEYEGAATPLPVEEASRFWGVVDKRRTSLLKQHADSMGNYGTRTVKKIENELALSLMQKETTDQAIDRVRGAADMQWYQAERIVRTETSWAYNATHSDGIIAIAEEIPDIFVRWVEHATDSVPSEPTDERTADDSLVMHGQVVIPGEMFTMPPDPLAPEELVGESWFFPPNRPNDRAVVAAWRPTWGGLAWTFTGWRKQYLSR